MTKMKRCKIDDDTDDDADDKTDDMGVTCIDNHVFFYADVSKETVLRLHHCLHRIDKRHDGITLHIHSDGGCAFSGLFAMDLIGKYNVTTIAEGMCASAATFMLLGGKVKKMSKHSLILIHEITSLVGWTRFTELQNEMHNNQLLMDMITSIYRKKTKLGKKDLSKMLKTDKYINDTQAMEYGLVDEIY